MLTPSIDSINRSLLHANVTDWLTAMLITYGKRFPEHYVNTVTVNGKSTYYRYCVENGYITKLPDGTYELTELGMEFINDKTKASNQT